MPSPSRPDPERGGAGEAGGHQVWLILAYKKPIAFIYSVANRFGTNTSFTRRQSESATLLVLGFLQDFKNLTCELSRLMLMIPKILFLPICKAYVLRVRVHVRRFRFRLIGTFQVIYN